MKPKRWKNGRRIGLDVPRGTIIANMGSSSREFMDPRNN